MRVGITGGIGSGKSIVSKILESLGYPVFNSDDVAKAILDTDPVLKSELIELFGTYLYDHNGLDRAKLAKIIFSDDDARLNVNQLIHPKVRKAFDDFAQKNTSELVFNEAAILFETDAYKRFDKTILITAPETLRIERVMKRDNVTESEVRSRIAKQWSDEEKAKLADFILVNDEQQPLLNQVERTLSELLK